MWRQESVPYLAVILFGACGWGIVFVIERITDAPAVEYNVTWESKAQPKKVTLEIVNMSYTTRFERIEFNIGSRSEEPGRFQNSNIDCDPPAFKAGTGPDISDDHAEVTFVFTGLQPGDRCKAWASYDGSDEPNVRLLESKDPIKLMKRSFPWTLMIRHQGWFILIFSALILIVASILLFFREGGRPTNDDG